MRIGIIGGGPAGYSAALGLSENDNKVQLFEKEEVGGVCLNVGCIPTKSLIHSASIYDICDGSKINVDWEEIKNKKDLAVKRNLMGLKGLLKEGKVEVINKEALLKENGSIEVSGNDYNFDKVILAVGSKPLTPPFSVPEDVWYSADALSAGDIPDSIVIIGAGYIGLEFGYIFSCVGSKVTIIEKENEVLPGEDVEFARFLRKSLRRKSIKFHLSSEVVDVKKESDKYQVFLRSNHKKENIEAEKVLIAIGRKPNVDNLPGRVLKENRFIEVNDFLETKIKDVYAIGDCRGGYLLAHSAFKDAEIVKMNILGDRRKKDLFSVPRVIYTKPEFASVGYSEEKLKQEGIDYKVAKVNFAANGRAIVTGKTAGAIKLIYNLKGRILGGIIVGEDASELITFLSLSIDNKVNLDSLSETVFPHPTFSEVIGQVTSNALREGVKSN
jgi:dihydrolipoamide dehydrogenase